MSAAAMPADADSIDRNGGQLKRSTMQEGQWQERAGGRLMTSAASCAISPAPTKAPPLQPAPEFNDHCDELLGRLGLDQEAILQLKIDGAVA